MKRKDIEGIDYASLPTYVITGVTDYEQVGGLVSTIAYRVRDGVPIPLFEVISTTPGARTALGSGYIELSQIAEAALLALKTMGSA